MPARSVRIAIASVSLSLVLAFALLGGCNGRQGTGTIDLRVTDAPFPVNLVSQATVTITKIQIRAAASQPAASSQPSGDDDESAESELADDTPDTGDGTTAAAKGGSGAQATDDDSQEPTEEDDSADAASGPWVTIFEDSKTFNLLDLRNGRTDLLASADVPAGTYTQMRLIVTEGSITLTDGRTFDLKVPSGEQTGIKLHFTFTVQEGETQPLLLDVDLARAFQPIPGSGARRPEDIRQFHFKPSVAMRLINVVKAGSISGTVTGTSGPLAGATVAATRDGTTVTSTTTEADGTYTLSGLPTGTYAVTFAAEGYTQAEVSDVAVTAGQQTAGVDITLAAGASGSQAAQ